jgi:lysozyme
MTRDGIEQLRRHEGFRTHAYKCSEGKITIGYGRNIDEDGGPGISKAEAEFLLANDVATYEASVKARIPLYADLDPVRQDILVNMAFNMGVDGLMKFRKMLKAIAQQDWEKAGREMLDSRWARQVGYRSEELSLQMVTGERQ